MSDCGDCCESVDSKPGVGCVTSSDNLTSNEMSGQCGSAVPFGGLCGGGGGEGMITADSP